MTIHKFDKTPVVLGDTLRAGTRYEIHRLRHRGEIVTREMLAREVWREPRRLTSLDNVIDVHIAHLRRKVDADAEVKLIHTVRGVGFALREEQA